MSAYVFFRISPFFIKFAHENRKSGLQLGIE